MGTQDLTLPHSRLVWPEASAHDRRPDLDAGPTSARAPRPALQADTRAAAAARAALLAICHTVTARPERLELPQVLSALGNATRALSGAPWPARCELAGRDLAAACAIAPEPTDLCAAADAMEAACWAAYAATGVPREGRPRRG